MTVDVDGWSSLLKFYSIKHNPVKANSQVNITYGIKRLLDIFKKHDIKATFFVTGEMAQSYERLIKTIYEAEHEIACHGLMHDKDECLLHFEEQKRRITKATRILQKIIGYPPKGFRAPCLRANANTLIILEKLGYTYDSSVLPSLVPGYYGYLTNFLRPYSPSFASLTKKGKSRILEIPVSVNPFFRIPLSGGWMRNLGVNWVKAGIRWNFNQRNPVIFYVHPRDVMTLPRVKGLPWHVYINTGTKTIKILDEVIGYAKKSGKIITEMELAQMFLSKMI